jgi:magnesium-transporting ATPase (P-type)
MTKPLTVKSPSKYTSFYLVLLILTTISAVFGVLSFGAIGTTLGYLQTAPIFAYNNLLQYLITILMVVALVFLYKKREMGLLLIISAYALTIISMIILPLATQPLVSETARQIVADSKGELTMEFAENFSRTVFMSIAVIGAVSSILFAVLWYFAWKKQTKRDNQTTKGSA